MGIHCTDGFIPGKAGADVDAYVFLRTRKQNLYPFLDETASGWTEDDVFDIIEFLYDHISEPIDEGRFHGWCGCHYSEFDTTGRARVELRENVNEFLGDVGDGYSLSENGEVLQSVEHEFQPLISAAVPLSAPSDVVESIASATRKFRARHSDDDDKKDAIRDLAAALEYIRPKLKTVLASKDEGALFEIANKFAIRHHNASQNSNYDKKIWYRWMFYFYLSTLHAGLRMIERQKKQAAS